MKKASNFLAVSILEEGKRLAYVLQVSTSENLLAVLQRRPHAETVTICATKKEATQLCNAWNESYRANGDYYFGGKVYPASVFSA